MRLSTYRGYQIKSDGGRGRVWIDTGEHGIDYGYFATESDAEEQIDMLHDLSAEEAEVALIRLERAALNARVTFLPRRCL